MKRRSLLGIAMALVAGDGQRLPDGVHLRVSDLRAARRIRRLRSGHGDEDDDPVHDDDGGPKAAPKKPGKKPTTP